MTDLIELKDDRSEKIRYDSPDYPVYIRRGVLSRYPNHAAPCHWHNDIELIAVLDGEMVYNVNGELSRLKKGEGIFVNARQLHFGFSDKSDKSDNKECNFICVILHPLLLCSAPACERDFVLPVVRSSLPFVRLNPNTGWQRAVLEQIHMIAQNKEEKSAPLKILSSFYAIWSLLYENLPLQNYLSVPAGSDLTAARNMADFIQKNYARKISLKEIAASGAAGQSKCCKLFAKYFGQTPNTYLNQYRLNKSLELLRGSDMSVTEIALSVGFGGSSYYSEIFRKYFGKSPTEYRNHNKTGPSA